VYADFQISHVNRCVRWGTVDALSEGLDAIYTVMNSYTSNPLSNGYLDEFNPMASLQTWVRGERLHTSMSVGDVVEFEGTYYLCADFGWTVLN